MPIKPTNDEGLQLNLTPMIDVVFLLVIFFMAATQFAGAERTLDLELPEVAGEGTGVVIAQEPTFVTVKENGTVLLNGKPLPLEDLSSDLKQLLADQPDLEVQLNGDARCDFQQVAAALAACRASGVTNLGITVEVAQAMANQPVRK